MTKKPRVRSRRSFSGLPLWSALPVCLVTLAAAPSALACAVCTGDPESPLAHGARQGILTMLLITYGLLVGMASMIGFVVIRARRQSLAQDVSAPSGDARGPEAGCARAP